MTPSLHSLLGGLVLVSALGVGLWALVLARRTDAPPRPLTVSVFAVIGLLFVHILLSIPVWSQADTFIPGLGIRTLLHAGGPVAALIVALGLSAGPTGPSASRQAGAMLVIVGAALLSYAVPLLV